MDGDGEKDQEQKLFCRFGCGFYGNPNTDGLCSVCYKITTDGKEQTKDDSKNVVVSSQSAEENVLNKANKGDKLDNSVKVQATQSKKSEIKMQESSEQQTPPNPDAPSSSSDPNSTSATPGVNDRITSIESTVNNEESNSKNDAEKMEKKKNRCAKCGKKIGLTGFECRCGLMFCGVHRYSDAHDCTFNYRELGADQLRRENPQVVKEKIKKI